MLLQITLPIVFFIFRVTEQFQKNSRNLSKLRRSLGCCNVIYGIVFKATKLVVDPSLANHITSIYIYGSFFTEKNRTWVLKHLSFFTYGILKIKIHETLPLGV